MKKPITALLALSMIVPNAGSLVFANEENQPVSDELTMTEAFPAEELLEETEAAERKELPILETEHNPYSAKYGDLVAAGVSGTNWYVYNDRTLVIEAGEHKVTSSPYWADYRDYVERVVIEPANGTDMLVLSNASGLFADFHYLTDVDTAHIDTSRVTNMEYMFFNCRSLTKLDLSGFKTSQVTSMFGMFQGCNALKTLDLSSFDTRNVTNMGIMFSLCQSLSRVDLSSFNTTNVTNMKYMFSLCTALTSLDIQHFDTRNVTNMSGLFTGSSSLTELNLSNFDTGKVTLMDEMFYNCRSLKKLDVSNFNTSNVTSMRNMFTSCSSLIALDLSNFYTGKVDNMDEMFRGCRALTSLDVSNFNTSNIEHLDRMFQDCTSLKSLDLSSFDDSNMWTAVYAFSNCSSLTTLDISGFDMKVMTYMGSMFEGCTSMSKINLGPNYFNNINTFRENPYERDWSAIWVQDSNPSNRKTWTKLARDWSASDAGWWTRKDTVTFVDVPEVMWYHDVVYEAAQAGLMTGTDETHFAPNAQMTRAMVATVLYRMAGSPAVSGTSGFKDVKSGMFYSDAVTWAVKNGVVTGYTTGDKAGTFGPNDYVTREQLCTMVFRYQNRIAGKDTSNKADLKGFKDQSKVSSYALDPMKYCVANGIISGAENGTKLNPLNNATRAECAKILLNASKV